MNLTFKKLMNMAKKTALGTLVLLVLLITSCQQDIWDEHYNTFSPNVDKKLVDVLKSTPEYSSYLNFLETYKLDSILYSSESKTLFIPTNEAFEALNPDDTVGFMKQIIGYHVSPTVFLSNNLNVFRKLLALSGKYISVNQVPGSILVDSIPVSFSSPLYKDGKFYELAQVVLPDPNIYEYMQLYNPFLQKYVDSFDTLYLDLVNSEPLGYNDLGQTVYDSVFIEENLFETEFFRIKQEFRNRTATFILFTQEQLDEALMVMADNMQIEVEDIPLEWLNTVFIPQIFEKSVFEGKLDYEELASDIPNIKGDTSFINPAEVDPASRFECSNGLVYNYLDFRVPEDLYMASRKFEAEKFLVALGLGRYLWNDKLVKVQSDIVTEPKANESSRASNDTIVSVPFSFNYNKTYSVEFTLDNIFPGDYILEWRGNFRPSGAYKVYVNSVDVTNTSPMGQFGFFDTFSFRNLVISVKGAGQYFIPDNDRNNSIDFLVENIITEYGNVKVKIEYQNRGSQSNNGLSIDYLSLTPYQK